jgi:enoyl-CoA hydratase/carnithine racemase
MNAARDHIRTSVFGTVAVEHNGTVASITMRRPAKRNALSREHMHELIDAFTAVADSDALGIVLAAEGPVFSAGHDFADMAGADLKELRSLLAVCSELMQLIHQVPQPVLAKVHALATAAGCQLVASCDLAIAAETAGFALPGGKGGLFCNTPLVAVSRNLSRKHAMELALTGDPIDAATAVQWGLINRAVPPDQLDAAVADLMHRCTRGSAFAKAIGKHAYYTQIDMDEPAAYRYASEVMAAGATTADGQEGITSFLEKRKPVWQNR